MQIPAAPTTLPAAPNASPALDLQALPNLLGLLVSYNATRDMLAASLKTVEAEIERLTTLAHQTMAEVGVRQFATQQGEFEIKAKRVYKAVNWNDLYAHITRTGEFDLLHKRLSMTALDQRSKTELPPGVEQLWFDELNFKEIATTVIRNDEYLQGGK